MNFTMTPDLQAVLARLFREERLEPIANLLSAYHYDDEAALIRTLDRELYEAKA